MAKCKLFSLSERDKLYQDGIVSKEGVVQDQVLFSVRNEDFKRKFKNIYGEDVDGIGTIKDGRLTVSKKAARIENAARRKAEKRYEGVDLVGQQAELGGGNMVMFTSNLAGKMALGGVYKESDGFLVLQASGEEAVYNLGDLMKEFPNSGFSKFAGDMLDRKLDNLAGLNLPDMVALSNHITDGSEFAQRIEKESREFNSVKEYLDHKVQESSNLGEDVMSMNMILDRALSRTNTNIGVGFENNPDKSVLGYTDGGFISISPNNIGQYKGVVSDDKLAYVYLHEKAHVVTMGLLNSDPVYRKAMEGLFAQAEKAGVTGYGMTNILEFAAESLTNPAFQKKLQEVETNEPTTIWERFTQALRDAFTRLTGIEVNNDLLSEVLLTNYKALEVAPNTPLNGPMSASLDVVMSMDMNGNYIGEDGDIEKLVNAAKKVGLTFRPGEGFFYKNYEGTEIKINRAQIPLFTMQQYGEYTNSLIFKQTDPKKLTQEDVAESDVVYNRATDPFNLVTIQNINDLHAVQTRITPPSAAESKKYEIAGKEYFRTTESLGFGVTELQTNELLANAAHIGNFKDELGKRIFSDAYTEEDVDFDDINAFVKREAWERAQKEQIITREQFEKEYNNPVSEESFNVLAMELARIKGDLMENHGVKKFHSDLIVWDNEKRIAGEIDVLAELDDGSFTVIDIKTRRKGTYNYEQKLEGWWSTEEKHVLQTNTYSDFMAKMGFRMNAPKIIMSKPEYPAEEKVNQATFTQIEGDNFAILIDLPRVTSDKMYDKDGQLTYNLNKRGPGNSYDSKLAVKSAAARNKYRFWREGERVKEGLGEEGPQLNIDEATKQLRDNIVKVQNTLQQYTNFVKKNPSYGSLSVELATVLEAIKKVTGEDIDALVMDDAILIATKFYKHAAIQLEELQAELKNSVGSVQDRKETYLRIKNYKGVVQVAQELFETIEILNYNMADDSAAVIEAREEFSRFEGVNHTLQTDLNITLKDLYRSVIAEAYLGSKGEIKMINELRKEAEAKFGNDEKKIQAFINEERRKDDFTTRVLEASREEVNALINKPVSDIEMGTYLFNSDVSINNDYVQLFHNMLLNNEQRFSTVANEKVVELYKLSQELGLSEEDIKALIVTDALGDSFLISDYKIEFHNEVNKRKSELRQLHLKVGEEGQTEKEKKALNKLIDKKDAAFRKWLSDNTEVDRDRRPSAKWKTDYSKLSDNQRKALDALKQITLDNQKRMPGHSLIMANSALGTHYFRLPGVLKTTFAHAFEGNMLGVVKKYWDEATKIELGDTEEGQKSIEEGDGLDVAGAKATDTDVRYSPTGLDGKPIFTVPAFFRGRPKENQNLDLFTIYALELQNGIRYSIDSELVTDATIFLDMVNASDFVQTTGINKERIISLFRGEGSQDAATIKGDASVVSKQIEKMMKNRVFAMSQEYGGKVFGKDINRIMATVGSYTAFASMSFKLLGSANNWVTGNVSAALEAVGGEFYTKADLAAAKAMYYNQIGGVIGDVGKPVKTSWVNQMIAIFDAQGDRDILNNNFERRNRFTQLFTPGTTLAGYSMGEHEIHATIMLSIMHANKVLNSKGEYLTKKGEVTKDRSEAASLVDAYVKEEDGIVRLQKWAEYSEFDTMNKLSKNGQATIRGLIKDRVVRTQGAFDKHMQSELNRRWYGKLFFQFKKHMAPHLLNRFRGLAHVGTSTENLSDDKKYFNLNAKTEEYGYYTSLLRFVYQTLKAEKMNVLRYKKAGSDQWADMTKHERANMIKTLTESGYILTTFLLAMAAVGAVDDDDDFMWGIIYLLRRQTNEGGLQYINPAENWRVLESPMAALGKINNMIDSFTQILALTEDYQSGVHKGESKFKVKAMRVMMLDRIDQFDKGYNKRMYNNLQRD